MDQAGGGGEALAIVWLGRPCRPLLGVSLMSGLRPQGPAGADDRATPAEGCG